MESCRIHAEVVDFIWSRNLAFVWQSPSMISSYWLLSQFVFCVVYMDHNLVWEMTVNVAFLVLVRSSSFFLLFHPQNLENWCILFSIECDPSVLWCFLLRSVWMIMKFKLTQLLWLRRPPPINWLLAYKKKNYKFGWQNFAWRTAAVWNQTLSLFFLFSSQLGFFFSSINSS